jgi:hypothetical protein
MKQLQRELRAKGSNLAENRIRVIASSTGNPDRSGDVIMPGAFKSAVLKDAVMHGWLDVGHSWDGNPAGFFHDVKMVGDELIIEAEFHTTEKGQTARTVANERLANGKSLSVSIGFWPDYDSVKYFDKGADLIKWAEDNGYDPVLLDTAAIKKLSWCRAIPTVKQLSEVSSCNLGQNPRAMAIEAKQFLSESDEPEDDDAPGVSLAAHLDTALAAVKRANTTAELRAQDRGRVLSASRRAQLEAIHAEVSAVLASFEAPIEKATTGLPAHMKIAALKAISGL